jgi:hypothetical protein
VTTIFEGDDCLLTLDVGDRIEYTVDGSGHRFVISTPLEGQTALAAYLGGAEGLADASRAAAVRDDFANCLPRSISSAILRWCREAGLPSEWVVDGRRVRREHPVVAVPQPGTGRTVTLGLGFQTRRDDDGEVTFTEQYRGPTEILGYSYVLGLPYDDLPRLITYLEADHPQTGDLEDRLIAKLGELAADRAVDPLAGQGSQRDLFEAWCREAGIDTRFGSRGFDRRETLIEVETRPGQVAGISFSIDSQSKELRFAEGYGTADDRWRDALYQLQFEYDQLGKLLSWLTNRVGPTDERLGPDDALIAAWRVLAERGELTPRRPMQVRDRVAGWLAEAGVVYRSYGSAWRETLLRVYRQPNDCTFTLSLTIDPEGGDKGIVFSEFYEYLPRGDDPGREYAYGVQAPYDALEALANAYAPGTDGPPQDRLVSAFKSLVATGELGDGMALKANRELVLRSFEAAGVPATPDVWVWHNSD